MNPPLVKVRPVRQPQSDIPDSPAAGQAETLKIDVERLSFFYGEKRALEDISIKIQPNMAVFGPAPNRGRIAA